MTRPRAFHLLSAAAAALGGCLSAPGGIAPMCHSDTDCDRSHGEVCEEGVCWGDPPPVPYAAVVSPPSSRQDLVAREIPQLAIPDFGWVGDLALEAPVLLSGKLVAFCPPGLFACDPTPLAGTVTVSRSPQFHGGPGVNTAVNVAAGGSFAIPVRRTQPGDDPYTVTIVPDATRLVTGRSAAEIVPPRRMQLSVRDNLATQAFELGGADLQVISGTLHDGSGAGIPNYRISAFGHWDPTEPAVEVSTVDYTDASGAYAVTLSDGLVGTVELVARPVSATIMGAPPTAAVIHAGGIDARVSSTRDLAMPNTLGKPLIQPLRIQGLDDRSGMITPASGAQVSITGTVTDSMASFTVTDTEIADADGRVMLNILDGENLMAAYRVSITPPAGSTLGGVLFDQKLSALTMLPQVRLPPRLALRGNVFYGGKPLANATITARPSLRFLWALDASAQVFVASIPPATATTPTDGADFVLKVDPNVAQIWGYYDLVIEPAAGTRAPSFVVPEFPIPRNPALDPVTITYPTPPPAEASAAPGIYLPEAAFIHGRITGPDGRVVEGAELKVYEVSTQLTLCSEVAHAPASCPIPAALQARNTSDAEGTVRLALPH